VKGPTRDFLAACARSRSFVLRTSTCAGTEIHPPRNWRISTSKRPSRREPASATRWPQPATSLATARIGDQLFVSEKGSVDHRAFAPEKLDPRPLRASLQPSAASRTTAFSAHVETAHRGQGLFRRQNSDSESLLAGQDLIACVALLVLSTYTTSEGSRRDHRVRGDHYPPALFFFVAPLTRKGSAGRETRRAAARPGARGSNPLEAKTAGTAGDGRSRGSGSSREHGMRASSASSTDARVTGPATSKQYVLLDVRRFPQMRRQRDPDQLKVWTRRTRRREIRTRGVQCLPPLSAAGTPAARVRSTHAWSSESMGHGVAAAR